VGGVLCCAVDLDDFGVSFQSQIFYTYCTSRVNLQISELSSPSSLLSLAEVTTTMAAHRQPGRLQDKVAVITGSSSGLGRAIAFAYVREGARVVCADLSPAARADFKPRTDGSGVRADILAEREVPTHEALNRMAGDGDAVETNGNGTVEGGKGDGRAMFVKIDVTKAEEWESLVKEVVGRWGRVDMYGPFPFVLPPILAASLTWTCIIP
jgi:hypothetical protein